MRKGANMGDRGQQHVEVTEEVRPLVAVQLALFGEQQPVSMEHGGGAGTHLFGGRVRPRITNDLLHTFEDLATPGWRRCGRDQRQADVADIVERKVMWPCRSVDGNAAVRQGVRCDLQGFGDLGAHRH